MLNSVCGQQGRSTAFHTGERGSLGHSRGTLAGQRVEPRVLKWCCPSGTIWPDRLILQ